MPQFVKDPTAPAGSLYIDTAKSKWRRVSGAPPAPPQDSAPQTSSSSSSGKQSAADKAKSAAAKRKAAAEAAAKKREEARKAAAEAKANQYNPLLTAFKSPKELRAEAEQMSGIGAVPEETLRAQQAQQEAGIGGLTTALANRLAGLSAESQAGLRGLTSMYGGLAQQAQTAGESVAAAAGAPTSGVPAASPTVATTLAALGAVPATYAPAAEMRGQMLVGESRSALGKALAERAARLSSDTAKYLQQLKESEYQKAVARETAKQNAALLGLKEQTTAADIAYKQGSLAAKEAANNLRLMSINRQIEADKLKYGSQSSKTLDAAKQAILVDPQGLVAPVKKATGLNEYTVTVKELGQTKQVKAYGIDADGALSSIGAPAGSPIVLIGPQYNDQVPTYSDQMTALTRMLVNAGRGKYSAKQARQWLTVNVPILNTLPRS